SRRQRRLRAQEPRSCDLDQERGRLDAGRLPRVVVSPVHSIRYKVEPETDFTDRLASRRIDKAGSLRGRPIASASICGGLLARRPRQVIDWIERRATVELIAIGIGQDVPRYDARAVTSMDADQRAGAMVGHLAQLFVVS